MPKVRLPGIVLRIAVVLCLAAAAAAQESSPGTTFNIGYTAAKPGEPIDIPITLSGSDQPAIGSIRGEISFPKNIVSFTRGELGLAGELSDGQLVVSVKEGAGDEETGVLEFTLDGNSAIRPGILAYLKFRVSTDAQKGEYPLKIQALTATSPTGEPAALAKGKEGQVVMFGADEEIPAVGCFIFSH